MENIVERCTEDINKKTLIKIKNYNKIKMLHINVKL